MSSTFETIEKLYHEPSRLAIMSELCGTKGGLTFNELKKACGMSDGNLSRHLAVLEKESTVKIKKTFVGVKPQTTVSVTDKGRKGFLAYLKTLEDVLKAAAKRAKAPKEVEIPSGALAKPVKS